MAPVGIALDSNETDRGPIAIIQKEDPIVGQGTVYRAAVSTAAPTGLLR